MIVELFSGIGHSLDQLDDKVIRIDIDPKTKPTIIADVNHLPLRPGLRPKHLHGSPPCKYFTTAMEGPFGLDPKGLADSFRLVAAFFDAVDLLEPDKWTLETPRDGRLGRLLRQRVWTYASHDYKHKKTTFIQGRRSLKRSIIPPDVMAQVLEQ